MKQIRRHHLWYLGFLLTIFAASRAVAQECPCDHSGREWFNESPDVVRPDLLAGPGLLDETENGYRNNVAACSGPFCGYACRFEGLYFSTEMLVADVSQGSGSDIASGLLSVYTPAAPDFGNLDPDVAPTARFALGWQTCDGLGVRARYWGYENSVSSAVAQLTPDDPNLVLHAWDVNVFDLEVVMNCLTPQGWDTSLSGGYRFAEYEEWGAIRLDDVQLASVRTRYIGNGLTGAFGVRRQLASRFSVMANARASLLFGGQYTSASIALPPDPVHSSFDTRYIFESQLGASYEHPICGVGYWYIRGGFEVQYWNDFVMPIGNQTSAESTLFSGLFLAVGVQR